MITVAASATPWVHCVDNQGAIIKGISLNDWPLDLKRGVVDITLMDGTRTEVPFESITELRAHLPLMHAGKVSEEWVDLMPEAQRFLAVPSATPRVT